MLEDLFPKEYVEAVNTIGLIDPAMQEFSNKTCWVYERDTRDEHYRTLSNYGDKDAILREIHATFADYEGSGISGNYDIGVYAFALVEKGNHGFKKWQQVGVINPKEATKEEINDYLQKAYDLVTKWTMDDLEQY